MDDREWHRVNVPLPLFEPTGLEQGMAGNPGQLLVAAKGGVDAGIVVGLSVVIALRVKRSLALNSQWRLEDRGPYLLTYQDQARFGFAEVQ